ncbi:hypothetical protein Cgig2_007957 [Carnegiea gigantea]|uniref:Uncharacterized protein n=1 Tax=Carnegiea gigantea TaxID=171969 RepID=A0A9Q1KFW6_9CARY|nr:hypothetical protein Cgig2_007957 [Carnegiea gigantea]
MSNEGPIFTFWPLASFLEAGAMFDQKHLQVGEVSHLPWQKCQFGALYDKKNSEKELVYNKTGPPPDDPDFSAMPKLEDAPRLSDGPGKRGNLTAEPALITNLDPDIETVTVPEPTLTEPSSAAPPEPKRGQCARKALARPDSYDSALAAKKNSLLKGTYSSPTDQQ